MNSGQMSGARRQKFPPAVRSSLATDHRPLVTASKGQTTLEYAMFTAVVAAALISMSVYVRRAIQANLKVVEEQINQEAIP